MLDGNVKVSERVRDDFWAAADKLLADRIGHSSIKLWACLTIIYVQNMFLIFSKIQAIDFSSHIGTFK